MSPLPRINPALPAIDAFVEIDGTAVRAIIPREVFERCLRTPPRPQEWLRAYGDHAALLDAAIVRRWRAKPQDTVVLRAGDFAASSAPRGKAPAAAAISAAARGAGRAGSASRRA